MNARAIAKANAPRGPRTKGQAGSGRTLAEMGEHRSAHKHYCGIIRLDAADDAATMLLSRAKPAERARTGNRARPFERSGANWKHAVDAARRKAASHPGAKET